MPTARAAPHPLDGPALPGVGMGKAALREAARRRRRALADVLPPAQAGAQLAALLLPWLTVWITQTQIEPAIEPAPARRPLCLAGYIPVGSEIDPRPMLAAHARAGGVVALPVVVVPDLPLLFRAWDPLGPGPLAPGRLSIPEPADGPDLVPDIVLVPLLAFDRRGHRLGQGGGFYDRTLAALRGAALAQEWRPPLAVGVAYAGQEMPELPAERHDASLDAIATEAYVQVFSSPSASP